MSGRSLESLFQMPCSLVDGTATGNSAEATSTTLGDLRASKAAVYDFWTTRCTNCPAALGRLDDMARERPSVAFVGVNIDSAVAAKEMVLEAKSEGRWASLTHAHLSEEEKEKAKDLLGMRTVPFYVIVSEAGTVLRQGNAKAVSLASVEALDSILAAGQKENRPPLANASSISASTAEKTANPARECEGGVCRLPRRAKQSSKPDAETTTTVQQQQQQHLASTSADTDTAAAAAAAAAADDMAALAIAATPSTASPPPDQLRPPAPANPSVVCEGDVCRLVRKKRPEAAAEKDETSVVVEGAAGGDEAGAAAPAATRAVECEGGVCRLVRKKGTEGKKEDSAEGGAGVEASPLGPGDSMPSLRVVQLDDGEVKNLDELRAGRAAVLDFWTTRCVRCPAALDALELLAAESCGDTKYVSVNLDDLDGARQVVSNGRWPSMSHVFAGREEDSDALESFKARAALKSVPFYVVVAADGSIEQIGGPRAVTLSKTGEVAPASAATVAVPEPAAAGPSPAPKSFAFSMDEDF